MSFAFELTVSVIASSPADAIKCRTRTCDARGSYRSGVTGSDACLLRLTGERFHQSKGTSGSSRLYRSASAAQRMNPETMVMYLYVWVCVLMYIYWLGWSCFAEHLRGVPEDRQVTVDLATWRDGPHTRRRGDGPGGGGPARAVRLRPRAMAGGRDRDHHRR